MNVTRRHILAGAAALGTLPIAAQAQAPFDLEAARRRVAALGSGDDRHPDTVRPGA